MEGRILYFEKPGKQNTETTLRLARNRAEELGVLQVVLASTHGYTALQAAEVFRDSGIQLIAVATVTVVALVRRGTTTSTPPRGACVTRSRRASGSSSTATTTPTGSPAAPSCCWAYVPSAHASRCSCPIA